VTLDPTTNPPSLAPICGFEAETLDENGFEIEKSVGVYCMNNDVASTFIYDELSTPPALSEMKISSGDYSVGATGQTYRFTMYTPGSIPMGARMDLTFPIKGWKLDCTNPASLP
jgi:hypothetical protein